MGASKHGCLGAENKTPESHRYTPNTELIESRKTLISRKIVSCKRNDLIKDVLNSKIVLDSMS